MLCALQPNDDGESSDIDSSDEDISSGEQDQTETTDDTKTAKPSKPSPKRSVVIVGTYNVAQQEREQLFQDELHRMIEPYHTICNFDKNVFYMLTSNTFHLVINEKIHNIYKTYEHEITEFQTMMMNVQHTEKIGTHITHIEVIV